MGTVVNIEQHRKPAAQAKPAARAWFCVSCENDMRRSDYFKLFDNGNVQCATCGAVMRTLQVVDR